MVCCCAPVRLGATAKFAQLPDEHRAVELVARIPLCFHAEADLLNRGARPGFRKFKRSLDGGFTPHLLLRLHPHGCGGDWASPKPMACARGSYPWSDTLTSWPIGSFSNPILPCRRAFGWVFRLTICSGAHRAGWVGSEIDLGSHHVTVPVLNLDLDVMAQAAKTNCKVARGVFSARSGSKIDCFDWEITTHLPAVSRRLDLQAHLTHPVRQGFAPPYRSLFNPRTLGKGSGCLSDVGPTRKITLGVDLDSVPLEGQSLSLRNGNAIWATMPVWAKSTEALPWRL